MAKQNRPARKPAPRRGSSGSAAAGRAGTLLLGVVLGGVLVLTGLAAWLYFGNQPVAVADRPAWWEQPLHSLPLSHRLGSAPEPPFPASEDAFEAGARVYRQHCAQCHGVPGRESPLARSMSPHPQQFFTVRERRSLAERSPGQLFWITANGLRRSGMPAYRHTLSDTEIWQSSLLLHGAADELPDPVLRLLAGPDVAAPPASQPR